MYITIWIIKNDVKQHYEHFFFFGYIKCIILDYNEVIFIKYYEATILSFNGFVKFDGSDKYFGESFKRLPINAIMIENMLNARYFF